MSRKSEFVDLSLSDFPFTVECFDAVTSELVWREIITSPGALQVPGRGRQSHIRITWPDGTVTDTRDESKSGKDQP